jgi:hypothetical protein
MMLGCYAEDPLSKQIQHRQQAQVHAQNLDFGADAAVDLDGELGWFNDGSVIRMEEFGNDIDWVDEGLDQSLRLQFAHGDSEDMFAREFAPFAAPATAVSLETASSNFHPTASG